MEIPQLGQAAPNQQFYQQAPNDTKKKLILMFGGLLLLFGALFFVLTSGGDSAGQAEMQGTLQASSDALGIIDEYENDLSLSGVKNDIALSQILMRGNFQKLNEIYNKAYKPKKKFSASPKIDKESKESLDRSKRNNTLDSDILTVLKPKIQAARKNAVAAKAKLSGKETLDSINKSIEDFSSIEAILDKPR